MSLIKFSYNYYKPSLLFSWIVMALTSNMKYSDKIIFTTRLQAIVITIKMYNDWTLNWRVIDKCLF